MLNINRNKCKILDALRNLVLFVQFKNMKNTHGRVVLLVKLQVEACNFTKSDTPPWVFFTFFKIAQMVPNRTKHHKDQIICLDDGKRS